MVPPFLEAHSRLRKSKEFDAVSFAGLAILDDKAAVRRGTWRDAKVGQRDSAERVCAWLSRALWILRAFATQSGDACHVLLILRLKVGVESCGFRRSGFWWWCYWWLASVRRTVTQFLL